MSKTNEELAETISKFLDMAEASGDPMKFIDDYIELLRKKEDAEKVQAENNSMEFVIRHDIANKKELAFAEDVECHKTFSFLGATYLVTSVSLSAGSYVETKITAERLRGH